MASSIFCKKEGNGRRKIPSSESIRYQTPIAVTGASSARMRKRRSPKTMLVVNKKSVVASKNPSGRSKIAYASIAMIKIIACDVL